MLKIFVNEIPIYCQVFMSQDVAKAGHRSQSAGEIHREYSQFSQSQETLVRVPRPESTFQRDNAIRNINATLDRDFQVTLNDVA